jgi:hypothetical protein
LSVAKKTVDANVILASGFAPVAYWRANGREIALPTTSDGAPDEAAQKAGFALSEEDAALLVRVSPHYKRIVKKGK